MKQFTSASVLVSLATVLTVSAYTPKLYRRSEQVLTSGSLSSCAESQTYSEENSDDNNIGGYKLPNGKDMPLTTIYCSGRYCDNMKVKGCSVADYKDSTNAAKTVNMGVLGGSCMWRKEVFSEDKHNGKDSCPEGEFVTAASCQGSYCDDLRLRCCKPDSTWELETKDENPGNWISEEQKSGSCPHGSVIVKIECKGSYCDDKRLTCRKVKVKSVTYEQDDEKNTPTKKGVYNFVEAAECMSTGYYSEEGQTDYMGNFKQPIAGMEAPLRGLYCKGNDCDDISVEACGTMRYKKTNGTIGGTKMDGDNCEWNEKYFSEESNDHGIKGYDACKPGTYITAISCSGGNCDNLRLRCCKPGIGWSLALDTVKESTVYYYQGVNSEHATVFASAQFSEEQAASSGKMTKCPAGKVLVAMICADSNCDNKRIFCVQAMATIEAKSEALQEEIELGWVPICTATSSGTCSASISRSTSTSSSTTSSSSSSHAFQIGISGTKGFKMGVADASVTVSASASMTWSKELSETYAETESHSQSCKASVKLASSCDELKPTNLVVWQFFGNVPTAAGTVTVKTCYTTATTSIDSSPKCLPGDCKDCNCQTCLNPDNLQKRK